MNKVVFENESYRIVRQIEITDPTMPPSATSYAVEYVDCDRMGRPIWKYKGTLGRGGFYGSNGLVPVGVYLSGIEDGLRALLDSLPALEKT